VGDTDGALKRSGAIGSQGGQFDYKNRVVDEKILIAGRDGGLGAEGGLRRWERLTLAGARK